MTTIATDQLVLHLAHAALRPGAFMATPPMDLHATDFTIAAYINLPLLGARNVLLGNWPSSGAQMLFAIDGAGAPTIDLCKYARKAGAGDTLVSLVSDQKLKAKAWHHAAVTFTWGADRKSPTCTLYLDGSRAGQVSPGVAPGSDLVDPYVLRPSDASYLLGQKQDAVSDQNACNGQIRDLRVFTTALAPEKIATLAFEDRRRIADLSSSGRTDDLTQILGLDYALMGALHRRKVLTFEGLADVPLVDLKQMFTDDKCYVPRDEILLTWPEQARLLDADPDAAAENRKTLLDRFDFVLTAILGIDNAIQGALVALGTTGLRDMMGCDPSLFSNKLMQRGIPIPPDLPFNWPAQADMIMHRDLGGLENVSNEVYRMTGILPGIPLSFLLGIDHQVQSRLHDLGVRNREELFNVDPAVLHAGLKPIWPPGTKHSITRELIAEWQAEAAAAIRNDLTGLRLLKEAASKALGIALGSGAFPTS